MYKVAILGCENSHANQFLKHVLTEKKCTDIEFVGVYSDDTEAAQKLHDEFGVYVADSYDEFVGKVDGIIITARHGDNHYKYAKPYMESGIPMFIDKPITVSEEDALALAKDLKENNIKFSGGSMCVFFDGVKKIENIVKNGDCGKIFGGIVRAPLNMDNPYGEFFFYSQHLVEMMCVVFGYYPKSVKVYRNDRIYNVVVRYEDFDVLAQYTDFYWEYGVCLSAEKEFVAAKCTFENAFDCEFNEFYHVLTGGENEKTIKDFIAPVFILNAINRSMKSGEEEHINEIENF